MEFSYEVKIPKERIAVLVGIKGNVKKKLEKTLNIKITIDSKEGDVVLGGNDSLILMTAQSIVRAIGRGFSPKLAFHLLDENNYLELIDMDDYSSSKSNLIRIRARAIGTGGKARRTVEHLTDTYVTIYGKTIGIIGDFEGVKLARRAFESLLSGSRHSTIYSWLEKQKKDKKVRLY